MQEPSEGVEYVTKVSDSGLLVEIEAFQNGDRITYVEIARSAWPAVVQAVAESMMQDVEDRLIAETRRANIAEERMRRAEAIADDMDAALIEAHARLERAEAQVDQWERLWRSLPSAVSEWEKIDAALKLTPSTHELVEEHP